MNNTEQVKLWSWVALHSFGGPAGQIAVIHKLVVEEKKIINEDRFLHALNFCMLLPGPEAQQLATYIGWIMNGWRGGLIAGGLFILPGFISILLLSYLYVIFNDQTIVQGLFYGMKPAIIAVVLAALIKISKRALKDSFYWFLAILAFGALFFLNLPFPLVVASAAVIGIVYGKYWLKHEPISAIAKTEFPPIKTSLTTLFIGLFVWGFPIALVLFIFGEDSTFHAMNMFFSKMAMVTFGGAYAVLSYVAQMGVEVFGWLKGTEMLDGLGMAETTPGPLIQVVQFVGFMGAYRFPDLSSPYLAAFIASVLTTWMTYTPCFLWIFLFAPYIEFIRGQKIFADALSGITAAVVGVICNLSIWFSLKTLFARSHEVSYSIFNFEYPAWNSIDPWATGICVVALVMQFLLKQGLFVILATSTLLGILITLGKALGYL
ncbi:MAG TPA: chromate efflux transporter [Bacteriovoracaceae bacterium]|nr:chromate efflux transporter [Bacteriovoracaceae bacterium]